LPPDERNAWVNSLSEEQARVALTALRERARGSLLAFTEYTKPDYQANWHHELLCSYLDRFVAGEIKRLMVFMPPQNGKSELVSRRLPAYLLGRNPDARIIATSYSDDLASRMNRDTQRIIDSDEYRRLFPESRLSGTNVRADARGSYLRNSDIFEIVGRRGVYRSAGVGGGITGMGFDVGIIDDPIKNEQEASSKTIRDAIWEWYGSTFWTRQGKDAGILLTLTRWHQDDLAGRLLRQADEDPGADQWTVLSLPAVKEGPPTEDDPRDPDEALWPDRYSREFLATAEIGLGPYLWSSLYQQQPTVAGGAIFNREWWQGQNRYDAADRGMVNSCVARFISWDTALGETDSSAYSVGVVGELTPDYRLVIRDVYRERMAFPDLTDTIAEMARYGNRDHKLRTVIIEDKVSGTSAVQTFRMGADGWLRDLIHPSKPEVQGSKAYRATQAATWCRRGMVLLPHPSADVPWLHTFEDELYSVPTATYWDQVDAFSQLVFFVEHLLQAGWEARGGIAA
jgi:predicted phage terminase large subunit-like protein